MYLSRPRLILRSHSQSRKAVRRIISGSAERAVNGYSDLPGGDRRLMPVESLTDTKNMVAYSSTVLPGAMTRASRADTWSLRLFHWVADAGPTGHSPGDGHLAAERL